MSSTFEQLHPFGWNEYFDSNFQLLNTQRCIAGRVLFESRERYRLYTERGEISATLSGKLRYQSVNRSELPVVGDWVAVEAQENRDPGTIQSVLPRKSSFQRKMAGNQTAEQVIAANIDWIFVMTSLNQDFNLRRIERYLTVAWNSGATPVLILSKADLCSDVDAKIARVEDISAGTAVHAISVKQEYGLDRITSYLQAGTTVALVGSSGVGKSTLMNHLAGKNLEPTREIRGHDDRGRHTTTRRQLIILPRGGLLLDTPGMRELQLWDGDDVSSGFPEIQFLAGQCYFKDCNHTQEPECAVRKAIDTCELDPARFESYQKLQKELHYIAIRKDAAAQRSQRKKWAKLSRMAKERSHWKRR